MSASVGDDVDQLAHLLELDVADLGEVSLAAEGHRAEADLAHREAGEVTLRHTAELEAVGAIERREIHIGRKAQIGRAHV